jgi:hypothetical protein
VAIGWWELRGWWGCARRRLESGLLLGMQAEILTYLRPEKPNVHMLE